MSEKHLKRDLKRKLAWHEDKLRDKAGEANDS